MEALGPGCHFFVPLLFSLHVLRRSVFALSWALRHSLGSFVFLLSEEAVQPPGSPSLVPTPVGGRLLIRFLDTQTPKNHTESVLIAIVFWPIA